MEFNAVMASMSTPKLTETMSVDTLLGFMALMTLTPLLPTVSLLAQQIVWLDDTSLILGRADGTWTAFSNSNGGKLVANKTGIVAGPITLLLPLSSSNFLVSNDDKTLSLISPWLSPSHTQLQAYDSYMGRATSGILLGQFVLIGHESGYLSLWTRQSISILRLVKSVNLRSPGPILSYSHSTTLSSIIQLDLSPSYTPDAHSVIVSSKDGDLIIVSIPNLTVVNRSRYNEVQGFPVDSEFTSNRLTGGINSISLSYPYLMLGTAALKSNEANVWVMQFNPDNTLSYVDSKILRVNNSLHHVDVFNIHLIGSRFIATTQEGRIWVGNFDPLKGTINPLYHRHITYDAIPCFAYRNGHLALSGSYLDIFNFPTF